MATSKSIAKRTAALSNKNDAAELRILLEAALADLAALRTAFTGLTAKLDADGGVTGTDYASTLNPAALTLTD
jgi:hypothetical protein